MAYARSVDDIIDSAPISRLQLKVFVICALIAGIDGVDYQLMAVAAPAIEESFGLSKVELGIIFSAAGFGGIAGALLLIPLADRYGRRPIICCALAISAVFTTISALTWDMPSLLAARFIVGIGLSGAVPCVIALAAEFSPARLRAGTIGLIYAAIPFGYAVGGFVNGRLLAHYPWVTVFYGAAALTALLLIIAVVALPESPRYLASRGLRKDDVATLVAKIDSSANGSSDASAPDEPPRTADTAPQPASRIPLSTLFSNGMLRPTLMLWAMSFFMGCATTLTGLWLPSLLVEGDFSFTTAGNVLAVANVGCMMSMAVAGRLMDGFGKYRAVALPLFGCSLVIATYGLADTNTEVMLVGFFQGLFIGFGATGAYAIAATLYPTQIRSTGISYAGGCGQFALIISPNLVPLLLSLQLPLGAIYVCIAVMPACAGLFVLLLHREDRSDANLNDLADRELARS